MNASEKQLKIYRIKIVTVGLMFVFFFGAVIFRAYHLQILGNSKLNQLAQIQHKTKLIINAKRGTIHDRNGEILAQDVLVSSVGVHPHRINATEEVKKLLLENTGISRDELEAKLHSKKKFEWLQRRIPGHLGKNIEDQKIKGVQVVSEYRRFYPHKELAGQVLGAVGYDAKALGGVELSYDKYLMSASRKKQVERDARGKFFSRQNESEGAHDLYLTIDANMQFMTEEVLREFAEKHAVQKGFAIVVDVASGEILSLAHYPGFNPNLYWKYEQDLWRNHAITDEYEPGSTFKPILMATALRSGKVKPTDKFNCEGGSYRIGNATINDHGGYGLIDAKMIIQKSSNIGATKVAQKIGRETFYEGIIDLGFGHATGISLLGETPGSVRPYKGWRDIEFSNISFGQGISVNGMQMVMAYTAMANGGQLYRPTLVKKITDQKSQTVFEEKGDFKKVFDEQVSSDMRDMLHSVTQPGGTARQAHVANYLSGGKTGTAQKFNNKTKAYSEHDYYSSFIGFVPLATPKFAIYIVYDSPSKGGYYGGIVAAPTFQKIAERALAYAGVTPPLQQQEMLEQNTPRPRLAKKGKQKTPDLPTTILPDEMRLIHERRWTLIRQSLKNQTVPDLRGLSLREVLRLGREHKIDFKIDGSGFVVRQTPAAGTDLKNKDGLNVVLAGRT